MSNGLEFLDGFDSQRPRVLRFEFTTAFSAKRPRIHNGLEFTTASSDLSFDGFTGLLDLSSTFFDGLDSQLPRVLRRLRVLRWPHGSMRPQIDGLTGLTDLSSMVSRV